MKALHLAVLFLWAALAPMLRGAESADLLLDRWLAAQTNLQALSAHFLQTRTLRALVQPLTTPGRLWFAAPSRFRWELGNPPQTIALRQSNELWVVYPPQKRVERYNLQQATPHWREMLALLEAGFPASRAELENRYRVAKLDMTNGLAQITLIPKQPAARRWIPELALGLDPASHQLRFTVLKMADGSLLRQDFTNLVANPAWQQSPFQWSPPPDYQVVTPLQRRASPARP